MKINFDKISVNRYVPIYLMASYAYYCLNENIISDSDFDKLANLMIEKWDNIKHTHKKLLTLDMLKCSTCSEDANFYPSIVKGATKMLLIHKDLKEDIPQKNENTLDGLFV